MKKSIEDKYAVSAGEALEIMNKYKEYATAKSYTPDDMGMNILTRILENIPGTVMVIDLHKNQYVYVNGPTVLGFDSKEFLEGGLARALLIFPAAHGYVMTQQIFPRMFQYFEEYCTKVDFKDIHVSYQTQLTHKDGTTHWYEHSVKVISTDELKRPHLLLKNINNINQHKKDNNIDFIVSYTNKENCTKILYEDRYLPEITNTVLSTREGQVLSLISMGMTSAQISDRLCISQHTVNTHRKNILKKTFCKGTADLTIFAMKQEK
jgi:DNA-binding CsgD family transcriptional regulator